MVHDPQSTYRAALGELRMILDQLVPGRVGADDVEALTARAATVVLSARAALRRGTTAVEVLADAAAAEDRHDTNGRA